MISEQDLSRLVSHSLKNFHERRIERARKLTLKTVLARKNPYLFKALGINTASELVGRLVDDHLSSSDETLFGETFFKPIALEVSGGEPVDAKGVDFLLHQGGHTTAVKVVSGPNVLNSSQLRKQNEDFVQATSDLNRAAGIEIEAMLGHCYGNYRSEPKIGRVYRDRSGHEFWKEITADEFFYQRLMAAMGQEAEEQRFLFEKAKNLLMRIFISEFEDEFCNSDGTIDWDSLIDFVSGRAK